MQRTTRAWWGSFAIAADDARDWRVGPLELAIARRPHEWRVAWRCGADPFDDRIAVAEPRDIGDEVPADWSVHRFAVQGAAEVRLTAALADRPVVVRPDLPFHLPGGRQARVYVSTPVWVRVAVDGAELLDIPSFRMSDTWFGPSPRIGQICYASRTSARLRLEMLPRRISRAITEVRLVNRGVTPLVLERLKVPVPALALYGGAEGLWTQTLTVTRTPGGGTDVDVAEAPAAHSHERLAPPRETEPLHAIARAFGAFLG